MDRRIQKDQLFDAVIAAIPDEPLPDLSGAVLARLGPLPDKRKSFVAKLFAPRPVVMRWRPVYALGMAAALAALVLGNIWGKADVPASAAPGQVLVQFRLDAPDAGNVVLAGDFTAWKPAYALRRSEPGVWTVVVPLTPGVHEYAFVVDGHRWLPDPMAPAVADGFGGMNSRLAVLAPDGVRGI